MWCNPTPRPTDATIISIKERDPDEWQWKDNQKQNKGKFKELFGPSSWAVTRTCIHLANFTRIEKSDYKCKNQHRDPGPLVKKSYMAAQNWLNPVYGLMCMISIAKYQTVIVVRQTNKRRTDSNALTRITMNRISTVNDKHTPALTPLAVANRRNWSLLRLVQFAVAGIELPSLEKTRG